MFGFGEFLMALLQIIWINILLSGDNAVVIAMACRSLPPKQQKLGIILGTGPAVVLRIVFTVLIAYLLQIPFLKVAGGVLLLWIAYKLMIPENEGDHAVGAGGSLLEAVKTIVIADAVMSLDNVIAIAAAAKGNMPLLVIGLVISIPLIVFGSTLVLSLINRFPVLVTAGAALLGYIAGEVIVSDPTLVAWVEHEAPVLHSVVPFVGAIAVVALGHVMARRAARAGEAADALDADAVASEATD